MEYAFCSFSFHRLLAEGKQDIFQHIKDCKELGACQLDPWNAHLAAAMDGCDPLAEAIPAAGMAFLRRVREAAKEAGLPWGCIACDGAHVYEEEEGKHRANRAAAYRWLEAAAFLGARQVRIDAGGPPEMPDHAFRIIVDGYNDIIPRAADRGVQVLIENHWGPSRLPDNVVRLIETIDGLGLLFDTNNWERGHQEEGWERCAPYAAATHIKTFAFDENGWDPSVDLKKAIAILVDSGYNDVWGIESCPRDGNEMDGARKTAELIRHALEAS